MAKTGKPKSPEEESHIIRSDNAANINVKMYGNTGNKSEKSEKHREDKAINSDPSTYPGGKKPGNK